MENQILNNEEAGIVEHKNSGIKNLKPFEPGHPKVGGNKKGWKSTKNQIRDILSALGPTKEGEKITHLQAMLWSLVNKAIKDADVPAIRFLLEQADDLINKGVGNLEGGNFVSIESLQQVVNNTFIEIEEEDLHLIASPVTKENESTDTTSTII